MEPTSNILSLLDELEYGYCAYCDVNFKTEGLTSSKIKKVFENHCSTTQHKEAKLNYKMTWEIKRQKMEIKNQQKQIDILIQEVKILNEQKEEVEKIYEIIEVILKYHKKKI